MEFLINLLFLGLVKSYKKQVDKAEKLLNSPVSNVDNQNDPGLQYIILDDLVEKPNTNFKYTPPNMGENTSSEWE